MHVSTTSPVPRSHIHALHDPNWKHAMLDEYNALITNGTWVLVPRPQNVNVVRSMWLFKHKFHADGSLSRYKACLIANEGIQHTRSALATPSFSSLSWVHQCQSSRCYLLSALGPCACMAQEICRVMLLGPQYDILNVLEAEHAIKAQLQPLQKDTVDNDTKLGTPTLITCHCCLCLLHDSLRSSPSERLAQADLTLYSRSGHIIIVDDWAGVARLLSASSLLGYLCLSRRKLYLHGLSVEILVTSFHSSAEAEYRGVTNAVAETAWVRDIF
ncbi:ribonuclease H-like domain-containing protein [Tanacetum coccineum]